MNPRKVERPFAETLRDSLEQLLVIADMDRIKTLADARVAYKKIELEAEEAWRDSLVRGMLKLALPESEPPS